MSDERVAKLLHSMNEIDASVWDQCANPVGRPFDPFVAHAFLSALEVSGSATADAGWAGCHVVLANGNGDVEGVCPMYLKNHSYGEYVFDHSWAHAFEQAGGSYYPKLQISIPFTPATGKRLLVGGAVDEAMAERHLMVGCIEAAKKLGVSSLHLTFVDEVQASHLADMGLLMRTDQQFHWENQHYKNFNEFLDTLTSRKRKVLKKERALALEPGIEIDWVTGAELQQQHWDAFYEFYMDTGARKWGQPYLTREFFDIIGNTFADHTLLILAKRDDRYIAGALNFIGGDTLFGRNWGCIEDHRFLHFEVCYYQAIDFAISRGLKRVEAGAQGAHKLARGYLPTKTYSLHWIAEPGLRQAIADYLENERTHVDADMIALKDHSPFKKSS